MGSAQGALCRTFWASWSSLYPAALVSQRPCAGENALTVSPTFPSPADPAPQQVPEEGSRNHLGWTAKRDCNLLWWRSPSSDGRPRRRGHLLLHTSTSAEPCP